MKFTTFWMFCPVVRMTTRWRLTRELIDIDSTTGREAEAGEFVARTLEGLGYAVVRQPVADGRFNVIASLGAPVASRRYASGRRMYASPAEPFVGQNMPGVGV